MEILLIFQDCIQPFLILTQLITIHLILWYYCCCCLIAKLCPLLWPWIVVCRRSFCGISLARILEWVAISSRGSSQSRDKTHVSFIGRQILYHWATGEAHIWCYRDCKNCPSPPCLPTSTPFALILCCFSYLEVVKWSHSVVSDSLRPHGL